MRVLFAVAVLKLVQFLKIFISQDSVATRFGCCGMFNDSFIAHCPGSASEKNENPLRIDTVIDRALCTTFWDTMYTQHEHTLLAM